MGSVKARWWLVPLAAAALVVGCGDDDEDAGTGGQMSIHGTFGGQTIDLSGPHGTAGTDYVSGVLDDIEVTYVDGAEEVELEIGHVDNLAVGTFPVVAFPAAPDELQVEFHWEQGGTPIAYHVYASSGTVTVTEYSDSRFAASFTLGFGAGETVSGSFDVPFVD